MGGKARLLPPPWSLLTKDLLIKDAIGLGLLVAPLILVAIAHGIVLRLDLFPRLKLPLDLGLAIGNKRLFGDNKTLRGLFVHTVFSVVGTYLLGALERFLDVSFTNYLPLDFKEDFLKIGLCLGLGMTLGELPNSFLKRQLGIGPGKKGRGLLGIFFSLLDQVDILFGIWPLMLYFYDLPLRLVPLSFILTILLHPMITTVGYLLRMRKTPY